MSKQGKKVAGGYLYSQSDILGTGTWGTVYKAKLKDQQSQHYALKKMNKYKVQASHKTYEKYQSEVKSLQKAGCIPQVIRIIDFFKSKTHYYIVTEYHTDSLDLYEYMVRHKNKFCEAEARDIWFDLLQGIRSLHDLGIYHRDLKLQNVLYLSESKKAKIIDFGMATCFPNPEGAVGSPMFMSPQVLRNQKYSYKCDIWSLGIIFYCMIFRTSPYGDNTSLKAILETLSKIKLQGLHFPEDNYISKPCMEVILGCLRMEQTHRLDIAQLLELPFFLELVIPEKALEYYEPCTSFRN